MPHPSLNEELYILNAAIDKDAFQDVRIDDTSLEILKTSREILNNKKHPLHKFLPYENEMRFVVVHYYDEKEKCFHARLAIGLHEGVKKETIKEYSKYFPTTRICRAVKNAPGVVHKTLMSCIEQEERDSGKPLITNLVTGFHRRTDTPIYSGVLGSSFKLDAAGHMNALNRSGQNEKSFRVNSLGHMCLMYPTDNFMPIRNQMVFKIGDKMSASDLCDVKNGKTIFITNTAGDFVVHFIDEDREIKHIVTPEASALYKDLLLAYEKLPEYRGAMECNFIFQQLSKKFRNEYGEAQFAEMYNLLWILVTKNGYPDDAVPYMPDYYAWSFINGSRNMAKFYFSTIMGATEKCVNDAFGYDAESHADAYSCQTDGINDLEKTWLEKTRSSEDLIKNLLMQNAIRTSAYDIQS